MRFCLIAALALSPSIALAEADQDHISYICDHENAIEIITSQDKPEQIILNAFGRERSLEKTTDAPHKTFVGEGTRYRSPLWKNICYISGCNADLQRRCYRVILLR